MIVDIDAECTQQLKQHHLRYRKKCHQNEQNDTVQIFTRYVTLFTSAGSSSSIIHYVCMRVKWAEAMAEVITAMYIAKLLTDLLLCTPQSIMTRFFDRHKSA